MKPESKSAFVTLIEKIKTLSEQGLIQWRESFGKDCFVASLTKGGLRIEEGFYDTEDGELPYIEATLLTDDGKPIEAVNTIPPVGANPTLLHDLFRLARFSARQGGDVLKNLLSEVDSLTAN